MLPRSAKLVNLNVIKKEVIHIFFAGKEQTNKQCFTCGPSCRKRRVAGGSVAPWGRFWPTDSAAVLPEHAGADGG